MGSVDDPSLPRIHYIDGPGGSGKTYLYNVICNTLLGRKMKFACTAWTGIASTLLPNGRTSASLFKLKINDDLKALETADQVLRDSATPMNRMKPFGGKVFVAGGDFRQVLPVVRRGSRSDRVDSCIKRSDLWNLFNIQTLKSNMRAVGNENEWKEFLLSVGDGTANDENEEVTLDEALISEGYIITETFGDVIEELTDLSDSAVIASKNDEVEKLNEDVLTRMTGKKVFYSRDEMIGDEVISISHLSFRKMFPFLISFDN